MALPAIAAALNIVGGAARGIQGNQDRQRAKGEIKKAYRLGQERLNLRQGDVRRGQAEGMQARGLTQGGIRLRPTAIAPVGQGDKRPTMPQQQSRIGAAMRATQNTAWNPTARGRAVDAERRAIASETATADQGAPKLTVGGARTLGEQQQRDLYREQQLEQDALLAQRDNALTGVDAQYTQGLVGAGADAIGGTISAVNAGKNLESVTKPQGIPGAFGIDPLNPLGTANWDASYGPQLDDFNVYGGR